MTKIKKRFFLIGKFLRKNKFRNICHRFINSKETEETLNRLYDKHSTLKKENEYLKKELKTLQEHLESFNKRL